MQVIVVSVRSLYPSRTSRAKYIEVALVKRRMQFTGEPSNNLQRGQYSDTPAAN
jgi:hypothetical protein